MQTQIESHIDRVLSRKPATANVPHASHNVSPFLASLRVDHLKSATSLSPRRRKPDTFDFLVVGAGFAGSVIAERIATQLNKRVLIIDKRDHIAGNAYDCLDASGILIHKYGPHIFHTNSIDVAAHLSKFTEWRPYEHRVLSSVDAQFLPVPINLDTINRLYNLTLDAEGMKEFLAARAIPSTNIRTSEDIVVSRVGRELYEKFFRNYTRKQWGLDPSELDASVAGRIPVRLRPRRRYFTDSFQAMPLHGYTRMFERMLDHPNITRTHRGRVQRHRAHLPRRPDRLHRPHRRVLRLPLWSPSLPLPRVQARNPRARGLPIRSRRQLPPTTTLTPASPSLSTSPARSHPAPASSMSTPLRRRPLLPIPRPENAALYARYKALADARQNLHFCGRLATYRYLNMDQVVAQALTTYRRIAAEQETTVGSPVTRTAMGNWSPLPVE